ncbi:Rv0361 family membrane protein [Mycobacterium sp. NPDC003323]
MSGPVPYPESVPPQGFSPPGPPPGQFSATYPGTLPPPVPYPRNRKRRYLVAGLGAAVVIAAVGATVWAVNSGTDEPAPMSAQSAQPAIQGFLDALADADVERIARHTLCGLYDEVDDKKSDLALAELNADGFAKQYGRVEVTSIDKLVPWSTSQAQALFTMRVTEPGRGRGAAEAGTEMQAVAQLLQSGDEVLVCSYVQRTG